jgi:hypothetical protein
LAACVSGTAPSTVPVTVQAFTIAAPAPAISCEGTYARSATATTASASVQCQDGKAGSVDLVTNLDGRPIAGTLRFEDGSEGVVRFTPILGDRHAYGQVATLVSAPAPLASAPLPTAGVTSAAPLAAGSAPAVVPQQGANAIRPGLSGQAFNCATPIPTLKEQMIGESISRYPGSCPCPYNRDRAGRRCGGRSAWNRAGGYSPLCFPEDIGPDQVREFCEILKIRGSR